MQLDVFRCIRVRREFLSEASFALCRKCMGGLNRQGLLHCLTDSVVRIDASYYIAEHEGSLADPLRERIAAVFFNHKLKGNSMLVLMRSAGEQILIDGENIVITIVEIRGDKVRLGISAPKTMSIHRREIYDRILKEENESESTG